MAADVKNRLGLGRGSVEPESGSTIGVDDILDSNRSEPRNPADSEYYVVLSEFLNVVPNFKKDLRPSLYSVHTKWRAFALNEMN